MKMFEKARKAAADTLTEDIIMIDVDNLLESPDNFFELSDIENLAYTILGQGGVKENLIVKPLETGEYEIISGHRRTFAVRHLLEQGEEISRFLPCLVQNYDNEDDKLKDLILMNVSTRTLDNSQLWKCYEILNEMFQRKKDLGEKFGRVQTRIAEMLNVSQGQVSKMQIIDKKAIPEIKEAIKNGEISINTAEPIANHLNEDEQKKLIKDKPLSEVKTKDVKGLKSEKSNTNVTFSEDVNEDSDDCEDDFEKISNTVVSSDDKNSDEFTELAKQYESYPMFSTDVVVAFNRLNLWQNYQLNDNEKWDILDMLMVELKLVNTDKKRSY